MQYVYVLEHVRRIDEDTSYRTYIGVYETLEKALSAIVRVSGQDQFEGCSDIVGLPTDNINKYWCPKGEYEENGFTVLKRVLNDELFWEEGFVTI